MDTLLTLMKEWGPAFLGWPLAGWLLYVNNRLTHRLFEIVRLSTEAQNNMARTLESIQKDITRLL